MRHNHQHKGILVNIFLGFYLLALLGCNKIGSSMGIGSTTTNQDDFKNNDQALLDAVKNGDKGAERLCKLLEERENEISDDLAVNLLQKVINSRNLRMLMLLVEKGKVNVNLKDSDGYTALHTVISNLLFVSSMFGIGEKKKALKIIQYLLKEGKADPNIKDDEGLTPFYWAQLACYLPIVECLVNHGANVNLKNLDGKAVLHCALENAPAIMYTANVDLPVVQQLPDVALISYLIKNKEKLNLDVNLQDNNGHTPFHCAVKLFIACNDRSSIPVDMNQCLILFSSIAGTRSNVNACDNNGKTAYHYVAERGTLNLAKLLNECGADAAIADNEFKTPYFYAKERYENEKTDENKALFDFFKEKSNGMCIVPKSLQILSRTACSVPSGEPLSKRVQEDDRFGHFKKRRMPL